MESVRKTNPTPKPTGTKAAGTTASGKLSIPEFDHDSKINKLDIVVSMDSNDNPDAESIQKAARKVLPGLVSAALKTFQSDMVEAHGKDVYIKPEEMNGHPTAPTYQPPTIAASAAAAASSAPKASKQGLLGGVTTIEQTIEFVCSAKDLMEVFFDQGRVAAWTRNKAVISRTPGSEFSLFGDNVTGTLVEIEPGKRFVQKWRLSEPLGRLCFQQWHAVLLKLVWLYLNPLPYLIS